MRPHAVLLGALAACGGAPSDDAPADPDAAAGPPLPDVVAVAVTPAVKGDPVELTITVANAGGAGAVRLTPRVTSARFTGFTGVPLGTVELDLPAGGEASATLVAGPFLAGDGGARFALGRGDYTIDAVRVEPDGAAPLDDAALDGGAFAIGDGPGVLTAVVHDPAYFTAIGWTDTPEAYLVAAFTRPSDLFDPDGDVYQRHAGGFDEMMGVTHRFLAVPGLAARDRAGGFCEQVGAFARGALGLSRDWDVDEHQPSHTDVEHHGFDYLIGLTPAMGGGAACGWLDVQVSGLFGFDLSLDRSQIILVHESGHLFGAPHCDPLQGYVMCAGELHPRYQDDGIFVWHQVSRDTMANRWR
jgi:hypothetical protein